MTSSQAIGDSRFYTTHWSLVAQAAERGSPESHAALEELCRTYWYPVYAFIRRKQHQPDDARELAQEFFARLLANDFLETADAERGRFRAFLLTAVSRFLIKEYERGAAQKRGGGRQMLSLDFSTGEQRYQREPSHDWTAERIFMRRWALTLLEKTLDQLRKEQSQAGKGAAFDILKVFLTGEANAPPLRQVGEQLEMTEGAVKVAVHRLRQAYREQLRAEILQTVATPEEVDDELAELLSVLRGGA